MKDLNIINKHCKTVGNYEYYLAIESQIRKEIPKFEIGVLLPKVIELYKKFNVSEDLIKEYPIYGYYTQSDVLKTYFNLVQNLYYNEDVYKLIKNCNEVEFINKYLNSELLGTYSDAEIIESTSLFRPRRDIISESMYKIAEADPYLKQPWNIENILESTNINFLKYGLVALAITTKDLRAITRAAETNSLYREIVLVSGCWNGYENYIWNVSPEVESIGKTTITEYNKLFGSNMQNPNIFNISCYYPGYNKLNEIKVVKLGHVLLTGENYYWILKNNFVTDKYTKEDLNSESKL